VTHSWRRAGPVLAVAVLVGAGIGIAANAAGVHPTRVASNSMSPAIHRGDWIVTRNLGRHDRHEIRRRDIVLFRFPLGTAGRVVKRVVAIAGDEVAIGDRSVTVDGRRIPIAGAPSEGAARRRVEAVPTNHVFLLGDNAAVSIDSRSLGPVPESEVVARVLFVIPKRTLLTLLGLAALIALIAVVCSWHDADAAPGVVSTANAPRRGRSCRARASATRT
jgi:signal peptidase I